jgi:hypothetical protein
MRAPGGLVRSDLGVPESVAGAAAGFAIRAWPSAGAGSGGP